MSSLMRKLLTTLTVFVALVAVVGMARGGDEGPQKSRIEQKLDEIRLPAMEIKEMPVREMLERLFRAASQADTREPKGVNIVLKRGDNEASPSITLSFPGGSLRDALNQVAAAMKYKIKVQTYAVALVPETEFTDELITREYTESPAVIARLRGGRTGIVGARDLLRAGGVEFPPGASACVTATDRLVIRNSEANLKAAENLLARWALENR